MKRILWVCLLVLGGCVGVAPTPDHYDFSVQEERVYPETRQDKGLVYLYRTKKYKGSAVLLYIWDNDKIIGGLKSGSYFYYWTDPGEHVFWSETESKGSLLIDIKAGHTYYILAEIEMGFSIGVPKFIIEPTSIGARVVKDLNYLTLKENLEKITSDYKSGRLEDKYKGPRTEGVEIKD